MKQSQSKISRPQIFRFLLTLCVKLQSSHALEISQSTSLRWHTDATACIRPLQHINATHIRGHKWSLTVAKAPSDYIEQTLSAFLSSSLPFKKHNGIACSKGKHTFLRCDGPEIRHIGHFIGWNKQKLLAPSIKNSHQSPTYPTATLSRTKYPQPII